MRWMFSGVVVLSLCGCGVATTATPVVVNLPQSALPPSTGSGLPTPASAATPSASPVSRPQVTAEQRQKARPAFRQALELWSAGRIEEARAILGLGLVALARTLPDDRVDERLFQLTEGAALSNDGRFLVVSDAETIHVSEVSSGFVLGLRAHDSGDSVVGPAISPKGTYVVAPNAEGFIVYETRGLLAKTTIGTRHDAAFAFLDDNHIVTVRLGAPESVPTAPTQENNYVVRELSEMRSPGAGAPTTATPSEPQAYAREQADDELVIVELSTGKVEKTLKLTVPPDQGLLRRVASLPKSESCASNADCDRFAFNPVPIGRRVETLKVQAGVISAVWHGGSVSLHRVRDSKLIGSFRARGESWKPGLVAVIANPPRAAVATSLPEVGRGTEPPFSVTALVDLNLGRVVELIDDCRWATGLSFSLDGKSLMVGDLRKACLHDARTGRLLDTTEEVRPAKGQRDEQQDVDVRPVQEGRWLLRTADGAFGVFDEKSGKALFRGRHEGSLGGYVAANKGSLYVADNSGAMAELVTLGDSGIARRILRVEELEQKQFPAEAQNTPEGRLAALLQVLAQRSCLIEGFRLPIELCRLSEAQTQ